MKLTNKLEKEVRTVYDSYWESYLKGDITKMSSFMDDDVKVIGSTNGEVFYNKNDAINFYKSTSDQIAGKVELRNRKIKVEPINELILFTEVSDLYILNEDDWTFYSRVRLSSLLWYTEESWKFIQQHGSIPDSKAQEGEQIALEKISQENLELRDAIKRRTADLEIKNKELKIEASLERIRAVAMSMQNAEDLLDVVKILYGELKTLRFTDIRNTIINIFNDTKEIFLNYDYSDYGVGGISEVDYNSHPSNRKFVIKMREAGNDFILSEFTGNELDEWRKWRSDQGQMPDPKLDQAESLFYYEYSIGVGSIGISTFKPINEDQLEILKKIRNVFDLAYRRYSDITQAEAFAREAQIEAALERVRANVLSMKEASDMLEMCHVISNELDILNVTDVRNVQTAVINETKGTFINYEYYGLHNKSFITEIDYKTHPTQRAFINQMLTSSNAFFSKSFEGAELKKWFVHQKETDQFLDPQLEVSNSLNYYFHSIGLVALGVSTYSPLNNEDLAIFKRFRNVFELAYRRFVDIEKALGQAREAQIEAALERVRSKTMAMHNSNDVGETVATLFDEVMKLGLDNSIRCGIGILEGAEKMETWSATSHTNGAVDLKMGMLDMTIHPMLVGLKKAWLNGKTGYSYDYIRDDLNRYYNSLNNEPEYPFHVDLDTLPDKEFHNSFFFTEGILFAFTLNPISDESAKVLNRFASVFGQTYRRYLDLQKAEAQAREAQIETALEKVRSKAMSMYNSNDLAQTVATFFSELKKLNLTPHRCGVGIVDATTRIVDIHATTISHENEVEKVAGKLKLSGHPILDKVYETWKLQEEYHPVLHGNEILDYYKIMNPQVTFPDFAGDETQYGYYFYFKEGGVFAWTDHQLSESDLQIFRRYTTVLSLTYRRYIDLKEAEAQNIIIKAENERKTKELEEARELQLAMLPKELPKLSNLDIAVYMQTATEVGGDYYDFHLENDGSLLAVIGDATGHGLKAGTIVTITKSLFHSLASEKDILSSFSEISRVIKGMNFQQLSMCLMMLKFKDNNLSISSAAMPPAFIYRNKDKTVEELSFQGMPLGAMKNFPYEQKETNLHSGDTIFLFSDGLPELINNEKDMYGYDRTKSEFLSVGEKDPEEIVNYFKNSASEWVDGKAPDDDVTFVVIKVK